MKKTGNTPLMIACRYSHFDEVKWLTCKGAGINMKNDDENTALMTASENLDVGIVKYLIKKGAEVNLRNVKGETALSIALRNYNGFLDGIILFLRKLLRFSFFNVPLILKDAGGYK
eukprot:GHVR01150569.1.p1 GENE.GHVR01150569.1~~GHVR01150569.1.p1  ORF type:complete len:116 (+),score=7.77 GHVR01150569.1:83-430(+)